ncbi:MAG: vanadium-dependent haloperoxidase [Betaproteobacteria bacterium]|nr:vanadium-dependent haloperoxidase [Betaproteobacteria bacterium]
MLQRSLLVLSVAAASPLAYADVILDWNRFALPIVNGAPSAPAPVQFRAVAIVNVAMFQAVNSIEPRYQAYQSALAPAPGASKDAAAAVAAARVLARLYPDARQKIDVELAQYLEKALDRAGGPAAVESGVAVGEKAAAMVWELRANDGANAPDSYRPKTAAGRYVPTAPTVTPMWPNVAPFTMKTASQFRPGPPVDLKSEAWARNYNESRQYGKNSSKRTQEQTEIARFWMQTGPVTMLPIAMQLSAAKGLDVNENARLFALLGMAAHDAIVAVMDAKYRYEFWRPVTAIRNGDRDGNAKTDREAGWEPIGPTPMHPEYPCAHCITAGAAGVVLQSVFGTGTVQEFTLTSTTAPGAVRRWTTIDAYMREPSDARIWAGIHYRFSTEVGFDMGRKLGEQALKTTLRPL